MRYLFLILILAGAYYGWDYYNSSILPRHEEIVRLEREPHPEIDEAQLRFDELAEIHERQADQLQSVIQKKESFIREYWESQMKKMGKDLDVPTPSRGAIPEQSAELRISRLMESYDCRVAELDRLKQKLEAAKQQLVCAEDRLKEEARQIETRLDINRIQRSEAANTKSRAFKVEDNRDELLRRQAEIPVELNRLTQQGQKLIQKQTEDYEKAQRDLEAYQHKVDRKVARLRAVVDSSQVEEPDYRESLEDDARFQTLIAPHDEAVRQEELVTQRTESEARAQEKVLYNLKQARDGVIQERRSSLERDEQILYTASAFGGVLLLTTLLSFLKKR